MGFASYYRTHELSALLPGTDSAKALEPHRRLLTATRGAEPLHRLRYLDLKTFLPCLNLAYTDRASMAASVEVRVPLLDHHLVEFAATLASDLLIRGRRQKYVLKRGATRYLPPAVVDRPKTGFWALLTLEMWAETFLDADGLEAAA